MFAFVDETGNAGANLLDERQSISFARNSTTLLHRRSTLIWPSRWLATPEHTGPRPPCRQSQRMGKAGEKSRKRPTLCAQ